jgi:serine/threonine-protein kinase RsbW
LTSQPEHRFLEAVVGPRTLDEIDAALQRAWTLHPHVPTTSQMQMGIATAEIGANIIEHAIADRPIRLTMDVVVLPDRVRVEFTDDGDPVPVPVDLSAVEMPDAMAERGRGLALAQAVLEGLAYRRAHLNHWTLFSKPFG